MSDKKPKRDEPSYVTDDPRVTDIDGRIAKATKEHAARMRRLRREREQVATAVEMEHLRAEVARLSGGGNGAGPAGRPSATQSAPDMA